MKRFLKSTCPFDVMEEEITWGEFIVLVIKGLFGFAAFYAYYILAVCAGEILRAL